MDGARAKELGGGRRGHPANARSDEAAIARGVRPGREPAVIHPAELVDNLVALLRDVPELVSKMGGDEERIFAAHDQ